ncbi:hypothetical protein Taro_051445 [Colocasia esculenta]|uniref:Uncharacterized protein n=1 Tax=Colocasia esculenta TaxID=4460 RepID=A0A843XGT0_COLES|nr:hypothetical protein [Colocasia esculenta]
MYSKERKRYNRLVDHVGIHGQRRLTEALNKDSLVRRKEYPTESSSKSRESVLGYNRLVDHVRIHGQRRLTEALNKDSLVRRKEYPTESSSKSGEIELKTLAMAAERAQLRDMQHTI